MPEKKVEGQKVQPVVPAGLHATGVHDPRLDYVPPEKNPYDTVNLWQKWSWSWVEPLIKLGGVRQLQQADLHPISDADEADLLTNRLWEAWEKQAAACGEKASFLRAMVSCFSHELWILNVLGLIDSAMKAFQALLIGRLVRWISTYDFDTHTDADNNEGYILLAIIATVTLSVLVTHHFFWFYGYRLGMKARVATIGIVHEKCVRLSQRAFRMTTTGNIMNLISLDATKFEIGLWTSPFLWLAPVQAVVMIYFLYSAIGVSGILGFFLIAISFPIQSFQGKQMAVQQRLSARAGDKRIKIMNELISGLRVMKMFAWEQNHAKIVEMHREKELHHLRVRNYIRATMNAYSATALGIMAFFTFLCYSLLGNELTAEKVYGTLSIFFLLKWQVVQMFPYAVLNAADNLVSTVRMRNFLRLPEFSPAQQRGEPNSGAVGDFLVDLQDVTAVWGNTEKDSQGEQKEKKKTEGEEEKKEDNNDEEERQNTLSHVTLRIAPGETVAVVGPVGCGKTSLLMAIMGELELSEGSLTVHGTVTYAAQQAFGFSGTVRDNVCMELPYDAEKFKAVVAASALLDDLRNWDDGEETEVGEKGITLSGGQKARIGLARAMYADADVVLLDDPLSAVDPAVGKHIVQEGVLGYLKDKTCVLVTHQVQLLQEMDRIVVMDKHGNVLGQGSHAELLADPTSAVAELLNKHIAVEEKSDAVEEPKKLKAKNKKHDDGHAALVLRQDEKRQEGEVKTSVYKGYFRFVGGWGVFIFIFLFTLASQAMIAGMDYWLAFWVTQAEEDQTDAFYAIVFSALIFLSLVFGFVRSAYFYHVTLASSRGLHTKMLNSVIRATMGWIDYVPVGRMLNRFSNDLMMIDNQLQMQIDMVISMAMLFTSSVILILILNPIVFAFVLPSVWYVISTRRAYLHASREIKRLEAVSRSPVQTHLATLLDGLTTIRCARLQGVYKQKLAVAQNANTKGRMEFFYLIRWLGVRLDLVSGMVLIITSSVFIIASLTNLQIFSPAFIGLALTQTLVLMGGFQMLVRTSSEVENQMTSVERVLEYSELPEEPPLHTDEPRPENWPTQGAVEVKNLSMRYMPELPLVLKNVNVSIAPAQKVGIVGRTGSGKSSFLNACFFRLVEYEGQILIDGVDIQKLGMHDLRSRLGVIPQDPTLFSGTVRYNLDPFNEHSDDELWDALAKSEMKEHVAAMKGGLDADLDEGGKNLSVGQRQLICLARAITRNSKVLIVDEATANVDLETDEIIQRTTREQFTNCTVLVVAHRLNTIIDSDKVMVFHYGELVECDHPHVLLQKPPRNEANPDGGYFSSMVSENSATMQEKLRIEAKEAFEKLEAKKSGVAVEESKTTLSADTAAAEEAPVVPTAAAPAAPQEEEEPAPAAANEAEE